MSTHAEPFANVFASLKHLQTPPGTVAHGVWLVGTDVTGAPERMPVIVLQGAEPGPTVWIQGGIHGDEPGASWAVTSLGREIDPKTLKGRVLLLPVVNLQAFRARVTNAPTPDGGDLYKSYPGNPSGGFMAQVAAQIGAELLQTADYLIDVHAGTSVVECINFTSYPGGLESSDRCEELALASGAEIVVRRMVRTEWEKHIEFVHAAMNGIPSIFISTGGLRQMEPEFVEPLKNQCKGVLRFLGLIPGAATPTPRSELLEGIFYVNSTHGGFVFNEVPNGAWLEKDQVIARIFDVFGREVEVVRCPLEKAILIESAKGALAPGELVAELFIPLKP